ncbi:hypothetical protein HKX48_001878 [Thoreauomyces humboldtii]|nr:hypothetical protein HKX48_001878 [Thoreauomyces humboldtii]
MDVTIIHIPTIDHVSFSSNLDDATMTMDPREALILQKYAAAPTTTTTPNDASFASSSVTFADQLSVASLEYMKRHRLVDDDSHARKDRPRYDVGRRGRDRDGLAHQDEDEDEKRSSVRDDQDDQASKILDVERIRRLPKLGMPGVRR